MKFLILILLCATLSPAIQSTPVAVAMRDATGATLVLDIKTNRLLASHNPTQTQATPGSTLKPFFLLAALQSNQAPAHVYCRRNLRIANRPMNCVHPAIPHALDPREALAYSCNTYFAELTAHLYAHRADSLAEILRQRGLDQVRTPQSIEQAQLLALGVEGITTSPLALAEAYRSLALDLTRPQANASVHLVAAALEDSVRYGTAHPAALAGFRIAGKTGTASATEGGPTHGWFAGFAPADHPRIVVVVFLNHGRGSDAAAQAREIFAAHLSAKKEPSHPDRSSAQRYAVEGPAFSPRITQLRVPQVREANLRILTLPLILISVFQARHPDRSSAQRYAVEGPASSPHPS